MPHKKFKDISTQELADKLGERMIEACLDDCDFISDVVMDGYKGYNQMTKKELLDEWHEVYCVDCKPGCGCDCHE